MVLSVFTFIFQQYINAILSVCSVKPGVWRVTLSCKRHKTDIRCPVILRRKPDYISDSETHDTDDGQSTSRDRLRGRIDRGVQAAVTASGLMVLMTLMLIFVYLLFAVLPLFKPASLGQAQPLPIAASAPALALGMDVQQRVGYRIDAQGAGQFYRLTPAPNGQPQAPLAQQTLLAKPALLAQAAGERDLFALAQADGRLVVARADFATAENGRPQWLFPLGQQPLAMDPQRKPLKLLSLADAHRGQYLLAGVTDDRRLVFGRFSPDRPPQFSERPLEHDAEQLVLTPDGRQLYLLTGNRLARYQIDGAQLQLRETRTLGEHAPYQMTALPGGSALLIKGADGNLREWFEVEKSSAGA